MAAALSDRAVLADETLTHAGIMNHDNISSGLREMRFEV